MKSIKKRKMSRRCKKTQDIQYQFWWCSVQFLLNVYFQYLVILLVRNGLKCSVKWLTKWSSWTIMARDYFEEVLRANYKKFIKNNWFFVFYTERISSISSIKNSSRASSSATFFEHIPSRAKTERNFFRAFRARALFERANFRASRADFRASGARTQH